MSSNTMYLNSDNTIRISGIKKVADGSHINAATVEVTIVDKNDVEVSGAGSPLTLNYEIGSNGNYSATIAASAAFIKNKRYKAKLSVDGGPGKQRYWETTFGVVIDKS